MLWFGLGKKIDALEDDVSEIDKKLGQILDDNIKLGSEPVEMDSIDSLPDDPVKLMRIFQARKIKRRILNSELLALSRKGVRHRQDDNGEMTSQTPESDMATQARSWYDAANPFLKVIVAREVKNRTGMDIEQILGNEQLLGQVISGFLGMGVQKLSEMVKQPQISTESGAESPGGVGSMFVPPYDPQNPPYGKKSEPGA